MKITEEEVKVTHQRNKTLGREILQEVNRINPEEFLYALIDLRENGPEYFGCGICSNIDEKISLVPFCIVRRAIEYLSSLWPEHSEDSSYPVEGNYLYDNSWGRDKWEGEVGERRRRLLDYLINRVGTEVGNNHE